MLTDLQPPGSRRRVRLAFPSLTEIKSISQRSKPYNSPSPKLLSPQSVFETPQKQMCRTGRFNVVYPNGYREPREQWVPCLRRNRNQPCRGVEVVRLKDRLASATERPPIEPDIVSIEPRDTGNSRRHSNSRERKRDPITVVTLNFKFWNPFSSKKKEKEKRRFYAVRDRRRPQPPPAVFQPIPPPPPPVVQPFPPGSPSVVPIRPPRGPTHSSEEDQDESSSPPEAIREHGRPRSFSEIRRYEAEKERIRQREFNERLRRERNRSREREARDRAALLERLEHEERERQREREERRERAAERQRVRDERARQERRQARLRERLAAEQEAIRQRNIDRERDRIQQEREDRERLRDARRVREEMARRHWEEENARRRAAELARYRHAEQRRRDRAWQANIPLRPRHPVYVHHDDLDRGDRVIRDDIRAEDFRRAERRAERLYGRYDDGWLRRRNTVDGGRRWHDGYWRDRR